MCAVPSPYFDEASTRFVNWLTEITQRGHVQWEKRSNSLTATVGDEMLVQFLTETKNGNQVWRLFVVRDRYGELLRLVPPDSIVMENHQFARAADALFAAVKVQAS